MAFDTLNQAVHLINKFKSNTRLKIVGGRVQYTELSRGVPCAINSPAIILKNFIIINNLVVEMLQVNKIYG